MPRLKLGVVIEAGSAVRPDGRRIDAEPLEACHAVFAFCCPTCSSSFAKHSRLQIFSARLMKRLPQT
jgi:hypothetical protein